MRPLSMRAWSRKLNIPWATFQRQIHDLNSMAEGQIFRRVHGKLVLTEAGLRQHAPEYFHDEQSNAERIERLEKRMREQEWQLGEVTKSYKAFRKQAHSWFAAKAKVGP